MPSTNLPAPEASDPKEVAFAIEEAIAHWAAGKKEDAVHALSRAAEHAAAASMEDRARSLASAVAELTESPAAPPAASSAGRPPPPSAVAKKSSAPGARPGGASHAPPPPSARAAAPAPAPSSNGSADATTSVDRSNGRHEGLHVWVRTSARDPTLLLVRLLPDGHPPPPGAYEAYLQPVEEGANLLTPKH